MSIIDKNQPNWFGNAGEPLKSAYIYIGQPNQTPVENPKTVTFTDSSGNAFTATQPLRTNSDGQIVWNGKAITATVDGDYSMLIKDSADTQINGGYVPFVESTGGEVVSLNDYRPYGLLLADIKKLDVTPGQTVGSVGKAVVFDTLGADWLVESNTGSPADDIDVIDFDNGLQGSRVKNFTGQAQTAADKQAVIANINALEDAPNTVSTNNIQPNAVTAAEIANGAVTSSQIQSNAVTSSELASAAVGPGNIAANAVATSNIQDNAADKDKIDWKFYTTGSIAFAGSTTKDFDTGLNDVDNIPMATVTTYSEAEILNTYYSTVTSTFHIKVRNTNAGAQNITSIFYYLN